MHEIALVFRRARAQHRGARDTRAVGGTGSRHLKPGGRHIIQSVTGPVFRPPGCMTHLAGARWFTPPAVKCRPPG